MLFIINCYVQPSKKPSQTNYNTHNGKKQTFRSEDVKTGKIRRFDPDFSYPNLYLRSSSAALRTSCCNDHLTVALPRLNTLHQNLLVEPDLSWSLRVFHLSFTCTQTSPLPFSLFISSSSMFRQQTHLCPPSKELT